MTTIVIMKFISSKPIHKPQEVKAINRLFYDINNTNDNKN